MSSTNDQAATGAAEARAGAELTIEQAMAGQRALRERLALPPETFPLPAFVGMISDEIERMRAAGHDDATTAAIIEDATGISIGAEAIGRFYAGPEARRRGG